LTDRQWNITGYVPSNKQFSLSEKLTPEEITKATGVEPKEGSPDGKCTKTWTFYAAAWFDGSRGEPIEICLPCQIWDYKGARWSGYGPPDAFRQIGLLPPVKKEAE
jgi:hypothetical protein